jgi:hypothetical protein
MNPLTIIIAIVIVVLIYFLLRYLFSNPNLLLSLTNAQTATTIQATSLATNGSSTVPSSNFAYSIWIYINNWNYRYGEPKVVFGRMGSKSTSTTSSSISGISGLDPCPAVVLDPVENNLSISLGCFPGIDDEPTVPGSTTVVHTCSIANVPIQKWVNLTMSVYGRSMDVYIDGKLVKTSLLPGIASVNNTSNIYVTPSGGFDGYTAKLQYFPNSLNPQQAWNIYISGYNSNVLSNVFGQYQLKMSLEENGSTVNSITI